MPDTPVAAGMPKEASRFATKRHNFLMAKLNAYTT